MRGKLGSKKGEKEILGLPSPSAPLSSLCSAFVISKTSDLLPFHLHLDTTFTEIWRWAYISQLCGLEPCPLHSPPPPLFLMKSNYPGANENREGAPTGF